MERPLIEIHTLEDWDQKIYKGQKVKFTCISCNKEKIISFRGRFLDSYKTGLCGECRKKASLMKNYGVDSPLKSKLIQDKAKATMKERYGVEHALQNDGLLQKAKDTCIERYGTDNVNTLEQFQKKRQDTCIELYGKPNPLESESIKSKARSTLKKRYGVDNPFQSDIIKDRIASKNIELYGVKNPMQCQEVKDKSIKTCLERYGVTNGGIIKSVYEYDTIRFDSSWELAFYIYNKDMGKQICRGKPIEYTYENKTHYYYPDFDVDGRLYEIKGDHFFDDNNIMYCPFDESKNGLFARKQQCAVDNNVIFLREKDIKPYLEYISNTYGHDYLAQFKVR